MLHENHQKLVMNLNFIKNAIAKQMSLDNNLRASRNFLVAHFAFHIFSNPIPEATDPGESRAGIAHPCRKSALRHSLVVRVNSNN